MVGGTSHVALLGVGHEPIELAICERFMFDQISLTRNFLLHVSTIDACRRHARLMISYIQDATE